jgi:hypothetical protein
MMTGRVTMIMAALVMTGLTTFSGLAKAGGNNEAALKRQLEDVRQELHELQLKVQRMESDLGATAAPSTAAAPATVTAPGSSQAFPPPAVQPGAAPMPAPVAAPAAVTPVAGSQPSTAPVPVRTGTTPQQPAVPEAFQWRETLKGQWGGVKAGMGSDEIRKLLGTPSREFTVDGKPVWYYSYPGIGNGSVMFSRDGRTVAGWQHPPFGLW